MENHSGVFNKFYNHSSVHVCKLCNRYTIILQLTPLNCLNPTIKSIIQLIFKYVLIDKAIVNFYNCIKTSLNI